MHKGKYVFSQLLDFLDKDVFLRIANKYNGNRYVKQLTCYNQLAVLMFGYKMGKFTHCQFFVYLTMSECYFSALRQLCISFLLPHDA